jgi:hypothetical protein
LPHLPVTQVDERCGACRSRSLVVHCRADCPKGRDETAIQEAGQRRFQEFLGVAIDLGIITVDHEKLNETICIATEAAWEDDLPDSSAGAKADRP